ncbi:hypothetical protein ACFSSA_14550 [Luteolibacter algae]|uniref:Uncharacterized protein n=1 Tax=Luteolibacter algae TaxID=454151 RepID=A0ABW5DAR4_9BACT
MISGTQLLPLLIGAAIGVGGWMFGQRQGGSVDASVIQGIENQLRIAQEEIEILTDENESLRSLAQGGGEVAVPAEMIAQVEKDYGLHFISNPVVHRIATEELGYRVEAALESRLGPQGMDDRQEAYRRIGWLRAEDNLLNQLAAVRSVGAVGWFDEQTGEAWVTDKFDLKNIPDQAAMLRLLVRVLLNQHFPPAPSYPGDDAARAREALHAGAASGAETRFYAASARGIGFVPMNDAGAASRLLLALPDFIQGLTMFPVVEGKGLADTLFVKGIGEFSEGMRNAPANTFGIVLPGEDPRGGKIDFPEFPDEIYLQESAGYLGLRLWLSEMGDVGVAEEVARGWMRDGYTLFADGDMSSGLLWDVEFESKEIADMFETAAKERVSAMEQIDGSRFFSVLRTSGNRVRFLNLAEAETLEAFR